MRDSKHFLRGLMQRFRPSNRRRRAAAAATSLELLETRVLPAVITVTSLADNVLSTDGEVTLREALEAADTDTSVSGSTAGSGADTIQFAQGLSGTLLLNGTQLEIASEVTIVGPSQNELIFSGNNQSRVFRVLNSGVVSIDGVTIRDGSDSEGGGIRNDGILTISNSTIRSNVATFDGGGIDNFGTLTLTATSVHNNVSEGFGGGVYNWGTLNIDRASIYANVADLDGGGIGNVGSLSIANTTISLNSTEFGNGGGIQTDSAMTLVNSTLIGNRASRDATGTGTGGGIAALSTTAFVMHNTVVANNYSGDSAALVSSDVATPSGANVVDPVSSNNFVSVDAGFSGISNGVNGNQIGTVAARLDPLVSGFILNAGHYSHSPLTGSPLINAGSDVAANDSFGVTAQYTQAGFARKSGTVDIGSLEVDANVNVEFDGTRHIVNVDGTAEVDFITLVPDATPRITLNGARYAFDADRLVDPLYQVYGRGGNDQLLVTLSDVDDVVTLRPVATEITGLEFDVVGAGFAAITVDGGGGQDTVVFEDSNGDDVFVGQRDVAWMTGSGVINTARNFEVVSASSTSGTDTAQLSTSNGLAQYTATPTTVDFATDISAYTLTSFAETDSLLLGAVNASSRADFYDSAGNDVFVGKPAEASLRGSDFHHTIINAPVARAHATAGGDDTAYLYDSASDDIFIVKPEFALMIPASGNEFYNFAEGFDVFIGYASTGNDSVQFYDSAAQDTLVSTSNYVVLRSAGYYAEAKGFDVRDVYSIRGGNDVAQLLDSGGANHFVAQGAVASISNSDGTSDPTWITTTTGFGKVVAIGTSSGPNTMTWVHPLEYAFFRVGTWDVN